MKTIAITFNPKGFADEALARLKKSKYRIKMYPKTYGIPRKELLKRVKGADAIFCLLTERIDAQVLDAAGPQLKIVANYAVGFDNIDRGAAKERGIVVTNTPSDAVNEAVAEHAFALMLSLTRRISEADSYAKAEKYKGWNPTLMMGRDLYGKTLGIVGAGRIGSAVARRGCTGFGMKLVYTDMHRNPEIEKTYHAKKLPLKRLLATSDFVSLHVPLLPSTRHLISTDALKRMKKTAYLINTARGPVVHEKALLQALTAKRIGGAGLDVFECEPAIDCDISDNLELKRFDNVILTPHIGSATREAREAMGNVAVDNLLAVLAGKQPLNPAR